MNERFQTFSIPYTYYYTYTVVSVSIPSGVDSWALQVMTITKTQKRILLGSTLVLVPW